MSRLSQGASAWSPASVGDGMDPQSSGSECPWVLGRAHQPHLPQRCDSNEGSPRWEVVPAAGPAPGPTQQVLGKHTQAGSFHSPSLCTTGTTASTGMEGGWREVVIQQGWPPAEKAAVPADTGRDGTPCCCCPNRLDAGNGNRKTAPCFAVRKAVSAVRTQSLVEPKKTLVIFNFKIFQVGSGGSHL